MRIKMTVGELIKAHETHNPRSYFFSPTTLRWFGERKSDMRVLGLTQKIDGRECVVLSTLQRNAPGGPKRVRKYFDLETYEVVPVL